MNFLPYFLNLLAREDKKMLTKENVIKILSRELPYLRDNFGVKKLGLFGSLAKGVQKEDSDIDILIEFQKPIGFKFIDLAEYIEKLFDRKVDIITTKGLESIRIKKVAVNITKDIVYV